MQTKHFSMSARSVLWPRNVSKCVSCRGFDLGRRWGFHDAPADPLVGWRIGHPPPVIFVNENENENGEKRENNELWGKGEYASLALGGMDDPDCRR